MTDDDRTFIQRAHITSAQEWLALAAEFEATFGQNSVSNTCRAYAVDCLAKSAGLDNIWRAQQDSNLQPRA